MLLYIFTDFFQQFYFSFSAYFLSRTTSSLAAEILDRHSSACFPSPSLVRASAFRQRHLSMITWLWTNSASQRQSASAYSGAFPSILAFIGPLILSLLWSNPCLGCSSICSLSLMISRKLSFFMWQRMEFMSEETFQLQPYWLIFPEPQKATMFSKVFRALSMLPYLSSRTPIAFFRLDSSTFSSSSMLKQFLPSVKLQMRTTRNTVSGMASSFKCCLQSSQSEPKVNMELSLHSISAISAGFILLIDSLSILETLQSSRQFLRQLSLSNAAKSSHQSLSKKGSMKTVSFWLLMNLSAQQIMEEESALAVEIPLTRIFLSSCPSMKMSSMLWKEKISTFTYHCYYSLTSVSFLSLPNFSPSHSCMSQSLRKILTISLFFMLLISFQTMLGSASIASSSNFTAESSCFWCSLTSWPRLTVNQKKTSSCWLMRLWPSPLRTISFMYLLSQSMSITVSQCSTPITTTSTLSLNFMPLFLLISRFYSSNTAVSPRFMLVTNLSISRCSLPKLYSTSCASIRQKLLKQLGYTYSGILLFLSGQGFTSSAGTSLNLSLILSYLAGLSICAPSLTMVLKTCSFFSLQSSLRSSIWSLGGSLSERKSFSLTEARSESQKWSGISYQLMTSSPFSSTNSLSCSS